MTRPIPPAPTALRSAGQRHAMPGSDTSAGRLHGRVERLSQRMSAVLDNLDCGLLLCIGDEVVFQNRIGLRVTNPECTSPSDGSPANERMPGVVAAVENELRLARAEGGRRLTRVGPGALDLAIATVPLVRQSTVDQDLTLVVFGRRFACDLIATCAEGVMNEVCECLIGARGPDAPHRILTTLLFTDIVGSTRTAEHLGDGQWQALLSQHHARVRQHLSLFHGCEIDAAGDGFFATFDAPARAVRCALAICDAAQGIGLDVRAGLHTGECETNGTRVSGVAVHVAARIASIAAAGQVIVSGTLRELVAGSGLQFSDGRMHTLKGLQGRRRLFVLCGDTR